MVEIGDVNEIFYDFKYFYIWGLFFLMFDLIISNDMDLIVILGILLDLFYLLIGDVFVCRSWYVLDIDFKEELFWFKILFIYFVKFWLLDVRVLKVMLFLMV